MAPPRKNGPSKFESDQDFWVGHPMDPVKQMLMGISPALLSRESTIQDLREFVSKRRSISIQSGKHGAPGSSQRRQFSFTSHPSAMNVTLLTEEPSAVCPNFRVHCKVSIRLVRYLWKVGALKYDLFNPDDYLGDEGIPGWRLHRVKIDNEVALTDLIPDYYEQRVNNDPTSTLKNLEIKYGYRIRLLRVWWPNVHQNFMTLRYLIGPDLKSRVLTDVGPELTSHLREMLINGNTDSPDPEASWEIFNLTKRVL